MCCVVYSVVCSVVCCVSVYSCVAVNSKKRGVIHGRDLHSSTLHRSIDSKAYPRYVAGFTIWADQHGSRRGAQLSYGARPISVLCSSKCKTPSAEEKKDINISFAIVQVRRYKSIFVFCKSDTPLKRPKLSKRPHH